MEIKPTVGKLVDVCPQGVENEVLNRWVWNQAPQHCSHIMFDLHLVLYWWVTRSRSRTFCKVCVIDTSLRLYEMHAARRIII